LRASIYLRDAKNLDSLNQIYAKYFPNLPAKVALGVNAIAATYTYLEIELMAVVPVSGNNAKDLNIIRKSKLSGSPATKTQVGAKNIIYLSAVTGVNAQGKIVSADIKEQTTQAVKNLKTSLR
jgi:enamine deaminase RidA (YjgF/YER057c/UK114 family)